MTAQDAFGLDLQIGNGLSPEVFYSVGSLMDANPPEVTAETKDVTTHKAADRYTRVKAVLLKAGKLDAVLLVETHEELDALYDIVDGRENHNWKVPMPNFINSDGNHNEWTFNGPLTRVKPVAGGPGDVLKCEISIDISGKPSFDEAETHVMVLVDTSAGGSAQSAAIVTLPAGVTIQNVVAVVSEVFDGDTATTFEVGVSGNTDKYLDPVDVDVEALAQYDMLSGTNNDQKTAETLAGTTAIIATWTNTANASTGLVEVHVYYLY